MKKAVVDIDGILWLMGPTWDKIIQRDYPGCPMAGKTVDGIKAKWKFYEGYMTDEQMAASAKEVHMRQDEFHSFQNAGRITRGLQREGFHVTIASHRDPESEDATRRWLDKCDIPYDDLYLGFDKHFLLDDADIFIDDSPKSQEIALAKGVTVFSIKYDYNEHVKGVKFFEGYFNLLQGLATWLRTNTGI